MIQRCDFIMHGQIIQVIFSTTVKPNFITSVTKLHSSKLSKLTMLPESFLFASLYVFLNYRSPYMWLLVIVITYSNLSVTSQPVFFIDVLKIKLKLGCTRLSMT